jgi:transposase
MTRFIEGECRTQATLLPELLDDYIAESNPVRVIDVFTDELHLQSLGFKTDPEDTGRPAYHPATMLKIYIYGYLNRIQSSRRLEREAQRNVELMWLTGRLSPDFKTIADFRKNNGKAIQKVCREFVLICRKLDLFSDAFVAIDGSKFKAVNNRDRNFSKSKLKRRLEIIDESIARYLGQLESADRQDSKNTADISGRLHDKIAKLKQEIKQLKKIEKKMLNTPDQQISLTDPNARSMSCRGTGVVGYNVQTAVDTKHHIIVTHEVTNVGNDKSALNHMATCAKDAIGKDTLEVVADRGYYSGIEIVKCEDVQIATYVPKAQTSGNIKKGLFSKRDFKWIAKDKEYECPAGERMIWRLSTENVEKYLVSTGVLIAQHVG